MNLDYLLWRSVPDVVVAVFNDNRDELLEKGAESPVLRELANFLQLRVAQPTDMIPFNAPGPLSSMLVGGLAGAGLGYGTGYLAEKLFPKTWERGKLRRSLAVMGGGLGMLPGMALGGLNLAADKVHTDWNKRGLPVTPGFMDKPWWRRGLPAMKNPAPVLPTPEQFDTFGKMSEEINAAFEKIALGTGIGRMPPIPVNEFNQVIWQDPRVARPLSPAIQAAATGLVTGAASQNGGSMRLVSPMDIGRIAAGMGSGYLSGALVGEALGALMGMPDETQEKLKNTGLWAGIIANVVPIAFGQ